VSALPPNYLLQALTQPRNLFPQADPGSPWATAAGMPASSLGSTPTRAPGQPIDGYASANVNQYGAPALGKLAGSPPPSLSPGAPPLPGAPPSDHAATRAYANIADPTIDAAVANALAAQAAFTPYQEQEVEFKSPTRDEHPQRDAIAKGVELLGAALHPRLAAQIARQGEDQRTIADKDYAQRYQQARDEYEAAVAHEQHLSASSASREHVLDARLNVALKAKSLAEENRLRNLKEEHAWTTAQDKVAQQGAKLIAQGTHWNNMDAATRQSLQERAWNHAQQIGVRDRAMAVSLENTKYKTAAALQAAGMRGDIALRVAEMQQNGRLLGVAMSNRAADKREMGREGFSAALGSVKMQNATYEKIIGAASSPFATDAQRKAAEDLLKPGSAYYQNLERVRTLGFNVPEQENSDQLMTLGQQTFHDELVNGEGGLSTGAPGVVVNNVIPPQYAPGRTQGATSVAPVLPVAPGGAPPASVSGGAAGAGAPVTRMYAPQISAASQRYGVPLNVLNGIFSTEDPSGDPTIKNPVSGATGVAQFMPATAKGMGVDPTNPDQSIDGGARYFKGLLGQFHGNYALALAAYNWGPANVQRVNGDFSKFPPETQRYVGNIMQTAVGGDTTPAATGQANAPTTASVRPAKRGAAASPTNPSSVQAPNPAKAAAAVVKIYDAHFAGQPFDQAWNAIKAQAAAQKVPPVELAAAEAALRTHVAQADRTRGAQHQQTQIDDVMQQRVESLVFSGVPEAQARQQVAAERAAVTAQVRGEEQKAQPQRPPMSPVDYVRQELELYRRLPGGMPVGARNQLIQSLARPPYNMNPQAAGKAITAAMATPQTAAR
jgi:hypothetical protein